MRLLLRPGSATSGSVRLDVSVRKVVALEQQRNTIGFRAGVGHAVGQIELRRVAAAFP